MKRTLLVGLFALGAVAHADIADPATVKCTVTKVSPLNAKFFGFNKGPVVGDTTELDLNGAEIGNLKFASGAVIGPSLTKHNLVKKPTEYPGFAFYEVIFKSKSNGRDYRAVLIGAERKDKPTAVTLDVLESAQMGRMKLNSLEMDCAK